MNGRLQSGVYTTGPGVGLGRASEPHRRRPDQGLLQGQSLNGMNGLVVQKFPGISETPREQQELDKQKEKKRKRKRKRKRNYGSSSWRPARIKKGAQICEAHFDRRRQPRPIAKANRKKGQGTCKRWKETMQVTEIPNQTRWEKLNQTPTPACSATKAFCPSTLEQREPVPNGEYAKSPPPKLMF